VTDGFGACGLDLIDVLSRHFLFAENEEIKKRETSVNLPAEIRTKILLSVKLPIDPTVW
jgi:hypothetical protein